MWSYEKAKRVNKQGERWHFVRRHFIDPTKDPESEPYELYFRNDAKTDFGLLRFEKSKDNPYRNHEAVVSKIISNEPFRRGLLNNSTADIWKKNWK